MPEIPAAPLNLTDRTVLVTGGNGGIGLGMASACGAAGAQIVIWGRDEAKNEGAVAGLREAGITAHGFVCDVTEPDQVASVWERSVQAAGGRLDSVFAHPGPPGRGHPSPPGSPP